MISSARSTSSRSSAGSSAAARVRSNAMRAPRKPRSRQWRITPTLMRSPRSTRGTIRTTAQSKLVAGTRGLLHELARRRQPPGEKVHVGLARGIPEPLLGDEADDLTDDLDRDARGERGVGGGAVPREGQEDVLADLRERGAAARRTRRPPMLEVERRAVIDEVQAAVPPQEVRVPRGAVDVGHQRVEPDDLRRERR